MQNRRSRCCAGVLERRFITAEYAENAEKREQLIEEFMVVFPALSVSRKDANNSGFGGFAL